MFEDIARVNPEIASLERELAEAREEREASMARQVRLERDLAEARERGNSWAEASHEEYARAEREYHRAEAAEARERVLREALTDALARMEHLEGYRRGTKNTIPSCDAAIALARAALSPEPAVPQPERDPRYRVFERLDCPGDYAAGAKVIKDADGVYQEISPRESEWWVRELIALWSEGACTDDTRRAALVALRQLGIEPAAPTPSNEGQQP